MADIWLQVSEKSQKPETKKKRENRKKKFA